MQKPITLARTLKGYATRPALARLLSKTPLLRWLLAARHHTPTNRRPTQGRK